jgi:hypothetical protein
LRALDPDDFRRERCFLADEVFLTPGGAEEDQKDLISEEAWDGLVQLPTDVLLRTTESVAVILEDCYSLGSAWIHATPMQPEGAEFAFEASLDASDEFHASPFIAGHGFYRQATAGLRNAIEAMTCAAGFAVRQDRSQLDRWRKGDHDPKFGNAVELLGNDEALVEIDQRIGNPGLFGRNPDGILQEAYNNLCRYSHSRAGATNADIWQSNGPVFVGKGITQFWIDFCDTVALSLVLLKIAWSDLELPEVARPLFPFADARWHGLGSQIARAFFSGL